MKQFLIKHSDGISVFFVILFAVTLLVLGLFVGCWRCFCSADVAEIVFYSCLGVILVSFVVSFTLLELE